MGNGASTGQGGNPAHGKRDVREVADTEQPNWPELAEAPTLIEQLISHKQQRPVRNLTQSLGGVKIRL